MNKTFGYASALALFCTSTFADIVVRFQESAPKDRFIITTTACAVGPMTLAIDLQPSAGGLIFDVTAEGAGVEVFQPVEVQAGRAQTSPVVDGSQMLTLDMPALALDAPTIISADLDDVMTNSSLGQIRVSGSELDGATVTLATDGTAQTATFADGTNTVSFEDRCLS